MDLDVTIGDKSICTPVYIKMDAHDHLLLSEGVCSQFGIISYHPDIESQVPVTASERAVVPTVQVRLLQSVSVGTGQCALVLIQVEGAYPSEGPLLVDYDSAVEQMTGLQVEDALQLSRVWIGGGGHRYCSGAHHEGLSTSNTPIRCFSEENFFFK